MIKKTFLTFCIVLLGMIALAANPNCPRCGGTGLHQEGGTSISHVDVSCRNCRNTYDAFYIHQCECLYCANYVPQSSDPDASWDDDFIYPLVIDDVPQDDVIDPENEPSIEPGESYAKYHFKTLPVQTTKDSDNEIPTWLCIVGGIALVIFLKWFFDERFLVII